MKIARALVAVVLLDLTVWFVMLQVVRQWTSVRASGARFYSSKLLWEKYPIRGVYLKCLCLNVRVLS